MAWCILGPEGWAHRFQYYSYYQHMCLQHATI